MRKISLFLMISAIVMMESTAFSDVKSIEGTVNNIRPGSVTIDVWGDNLEMDLKVNGLTTLQRINSLDDLTFGDKVDISYQQEGGKKIATSITKDSSNNETWL